MNDDLNTNRAPSRTPSDNQMESLLQDFFRLEVPTELKQPFRRNPLATAIAATVTLAPEHHVEPLRPRSVRFVGVTASVAAMAFAVLALVSGNHELVENGGGFAGGSNRPPATVPDNHTPMLVSPQGDSRTSGMVVGPDGVTLEETDGVEFNPRK